MNDSLAERMKAYEPTDKFEQNDWLILRVDGRAFHTRCRSLSRFDASFRWAMIVATDKIINDVGREMIIAYTNSDEASFLLCADVGKINEHWFGGRKQKIASVAASVFTASFNETIGWNASFDARVFSIPSNDIPNYFVWRMRDCRRNSVNILCRDLYGTEAVSMKEREEAEAKVPISFLYGTILDRRGKTLVATNPTYADFAKLIEEGRNE